MPKEDESKTKDQLLAELRRLRARLRETNDGPDYGRTRLESNSANHIFEKSDSEIIRDTGQDSYCATGEFTGEKDISEVLWLEGASPQTSGSNAGEDLTHSGSFDLRWMRWGAFARLLQAVPVSMLLLDSRGRIQFANQRFMEVAGETLTVFNECFYTFFPTEQKACEAEELVSSVMAQRDYRTLECPLRIGRVKLWAKLSFRPIRFGSERQVLVVLEDLTSQMNELALNMKYKRLVRNFPIGIVELSLNHPISSQMSNETLTNKIMDAKITEGNIEFARSHGYRNERELSGVPLGSVMPWGAQVRKLINRWVENGLSLASVESKERDSKDEVRIFETSLLGLVENGWVTRFWGMRQDITERKRTEEELIEKIKTIDSLYEHILQSGKSRVIADHTAGVAHELRQPLAIIGGLAGRLSKRLKASGLTEDPDTLESLEMMVGEVKRLEKILDGLIDFTRKETIKKQLVDPNELIKYVLRINSDNLREKGLRLESGLDEGIGSAALDPDRFQHVIRNLIANAIDASPVGGVISVSTRVSRLSAKVRKTGDLSSERVFEMKVHNHGSPIPPDELEAIFDPFCTTKDRGAGIGLTLSKKIAEEHDGSISVTSDEKGTQFTVWIPMD